jgi:hypothetical protein
MVGRYIQYLRGMQPKPDLTFNLVSDEMIDNAQPTAEGFV